MEKGKAQQILTQLKRKMKQREVYEAIDIALKALTWSIADDKMKKLHDEILLKEETQCDQKKEQN